MQKSRNIDTTTGNLTTKSLQLAWPAVLQAILVNFYAFNDFFFVGQLGDRAATAALSACFAILVINYTLLNIIPTGCTTLMAQYFGRGDRGGVASMLRQGLVGVLVLSVGVGAVGLGLLDFVVDISNVTPVVGERIGAYLEIIYWSAPFFGLMLVVIGAFRAAGNMRLPLALECFSLLLNVGLNYVLVLGPGPLPSMGITGAAIATAVSRGVPGLIGVVLIFRGALEVDVDAGREKTGVGWKPDGRSLRAMMRIGLFQSMAGFVYGSVYFVLNRMAGEIGPAAQGGLGAGLRGIEWLGFAFGDGFFTASITVVAQNVGAGKYGRALRGAWTNGLLSAAACQMVGFVFLLFPEQLSSVVTDDPQTLAYAAEYVGIIGWAMWAVGLEMALYGALIGAGQTDLTLLVSGGTNLLRVPLAAALLFGVDDLVDGTLWAGLGLGDAPTIDGEFSALAITIAATAVVKAVLFILYLTIRRRFRERQEVY